MAKIILLIAALVIANGALGRAVGSTYYASLTGDDTNPGTLVQPFRTAKKGVGVLTAGDTLFLRGGTYTEQVKGSDFTASGTATTPIFVSAYPNEAVTIQNAYMPNIIGFYFSGREYIEIRDVKVDGSNVNVGGGIEVFDNNITLRRVEVVGTWSNGIIGTGSGNKFIDLKVHGNGRQPPSEYASGHNGAYLAFDNSIVQGGEYNDNLCYGLRMVDSDTVHYSSNNQIIGVKAIRNGHGKGLGGTSRCGSGGGGIVVGDRNNTVENSLVHDNLHGIEIISLGGKRAENVKVQNNVICRNVGRGIGYGSWAGATGTQILNNTVCQNSEAIVDINPTNTFNTTISGNTTVFDGDFIALYNQQVPAPIPVPTPTPVPPTPVPPPVTPSTVTCTVVSVGRYADLDAKLTVRCDTNGKPLIPKGTPFTITVKE